MAPPIEIFLTIIVLSFWFLFPLGLFLSVSHVDKNTDQIIRLGHRRHHSQPPHNPQMKGERKERHKPHLVLHGRKWVREV